MDFVFFLNSALLGVGLAMDAFSVSIVNAVTEPGMGRFRRCAVAGVYAFFQFAMPLAGWLCVHTVATAFSAFQTFIPWIAMLLLLFIGGKMIVEAVREGRGGGTDPCAKTASCRKAGAGCLDCPEREGGKKHVLTLPVLLMQGVATSIDALSVGFTIAEYGAVLAVSASLIIALVTFVICMAGLMIGRAAASTRLLTGRAQIIGGIILILIGAEIFIKGIA